jgi:hypothetical protein
VAKLANCWNYYTYLAYSIFFLRPFLPFFSTSETITEGFFSLFVDIAAVCLRLGMSDLVAYSIVSCLSGLSCFSSLSYFSCLMLIKSYLLLCFCSNYFLSFRFRRFSISFRRLLRSSSSCIIMYSYSPLTRCSPISS